MNLPNKLTVFRIILIPFFAVAILIDLQPTSDFIALAIFVVASLTDTLDGYLARKNHQVTNFGKFLDPLADKLLVCTAIVCFVSCRPDRFPVWIALLIIAREFIISAFRLIASDNGVVIAAGIWGKVKTVVQIIMCIAFILDLQQQWFFVIEMILAYAAAALTVISLAEYLIKNWKVVGMNTK